MAGLVAFPFLEQPGQRDPAVEGGAQVGAHPVPVGQVVERRRHLESQQRHPRAGVRQGRRRPHGHAGQRQHAGDDGEQPRPVRRRDRSAPPSARSSSGRSCREGRSLGASAQRRRVSGGGRPSRVAATRLDQPVDQARLPGAPGRRPGGQAVGPVEHGQQFEGVRVTDRGGDRRPRWPGPRGPAGSPRPAAAGAGARALQVATSLGRPRRGPAADHPDADLGVVAAAALADVVEEGAEQQQVGPGDPPSKVAAATASPAGAGRR